MKLVYYLAPALLEVLCNICPVQAQEVDKNWLVKDNELVSIHPVSTGCTVKWRIKDLKQSKKTKLTFHLTDKKGNDLKDAKATEANWECLGEQQMEKFTLPATSLIKVSVGSMKLRNNFSDSPEYFPFNAKLVIPHEKISEVTFEGETPGDKAVLELKIEKPEF
jgi:hypothetical protein